MDVLDHRRDLHVVVASGGLKLEENFLIFKLQQFIPPYPVSSSRALLRNMNLQNHKTFIS